MEINIDLKSVRRFCRSLEQPRYFLRWQEQQFPKVKYVFVRSQTKELALAAVQSPEWRSEGRPFFPQYDSWDDGGETLHLQHATDAGASLLGYVVGTEDAREDVLTMTRAFEIALPKFGLGLPFWPSDGQSTMLFLWKNCFDLYGGEEPFHCWPANDFGDAEAFQLSVNPFAAMGRVLDYLREADGFLSVVPPSGIVTIDPGIAAEPALNDDAYVPAEALRLTLGTYLSYKQFKKLLDDNVNEIRTRSVRSNRLLVHAADWVQFQSKFNLLKAATDAASRVEAEKAAMRARKISRGEKPTYPPTSLDS